MSRGPIITPEVEALIASTYEKNQKLKAPKVQKWVSMLLRKDNPKLPPEWPSLSTVQKILATVRKKLNELPDSPQDKPWSMATLDDYPISPEAIPAVLAVWKFRFAGEKGFTIREAKWVSRLSRVLEDIKKLSKYATNYARLELIYQIIDRPFNSTIIDKGLMQLPITVQEITERAMRDWPAMNQKADILYKTFKKGGKGK